jgi:hypothetical protein
MKKLTLLWIISAIIIAINLIVYLVKPGGDVVLLYVSDLLPVLSSFITVLCLFLAVRSFKGFDFTKLSWILILVGIFLYFIAEAVYSIQEIFLGFDMGEFFPNYADYFWCAGYIPFFIGLTMMFNGYRKSGLPLGKTSLYVTLASLFFIVAALVVYFLLIPVLRDPETETVDKVFYMFYPIGDLLIAIPALVLVYITSLFGSAIITKPWKFMALGFILFTISDLLYSYLDWMGLYGTGNLIDLGWNSGYLLIGVAGLYQYRIVKSLNQ